MVTGVIGRDRVVRDAKGGRGVEAAVEAAQGADAPARCGLHLCGVCGCDGLRVDCWMVFGLGLFGCLWDVRSGVRELPRLGA